MGIVLSQSQASSYTASLKKEGSYSPTAPYDMPGQSLGVGGSYYYRFGVPFRLNNVITLMRVKFTGFASTSLNNIWYPLINEIQLYDRGSSMGADVQVSGAVSGRQISVQLVNETVGATITTPHLTMDVYAEFYSYPW